MLTHTRITTPNQRLPTPCDGCAPLQQAPSVETSACISLVTINSCAELTIDGCAESNSYVNFVDSSKNLLVWKFIMQTIP